MNERDRGGGGEGGRGGRGCERENEREKERTREVMTYRHENSKINRKTTTFKQLLNV